MSISVIEDVVKNTRVTMGGAGIKVPARVFKVSGLPQTYPSAVAYAAMFAVDAANPAIKVPPLFTLHPYIPGQLSVLYESVPLGNTSRGSAIVTG